LFKKFNLIPPVLEESKEPVDVLILKMINSIDNSFLEYKNNDNINKTLI